MLEHDKFCRALSILCIDVTFTKSRKSIFRSTYWTNVNRKQLYGMIPSGYISYYQLTSGTGPVSKMMCFLNQIRQQAFPNTCISLTFSVYSQHEISWNPFKDFRNYKHGWSMIICSFLCTKNTYEKGLCSIFVLIYLYINTLLITEQFHK